MHHNIIQRNEYQMSVVIITDVEDHMAYLRDH
jgi:hypothetical protein